MSPSLKDNWNLTISELDTKDYKYWAVVDVLHKMIPTIVFYLFIYFDSS